MGVTDFVVNYIDPVVGARSTGHAGLVLLGNREITDAAAQQMNANEKRPQAANTCGLFVGTGNARCTTRGRLLGDAAQTEAALAALGLVERIDNGTATFSTFWMTSCAMRSPG